MTQDHVIYWEIKGVLFGVYKSVSFRPFAQAQLCVLLSGLGMLVALQAHRRGLVPKFIPKSRPKALAVCG